jgi:hypothetical protein
VQPLLSRTFQGHRGPGCVLGLPHQQHQLSWSDQPAAVPVRARVRADSAYLLAAVATSSCALFACCSYTGPATACAKCPLNT